MRPPVRIHISARLLVVVLAGLAFAGTVAASDAKPDEDGRRLSARAKPSSSPTGLLAPARPSEESRARRLPAPSRLTGAAGPRMTWSASPQKNSPSPFQDVDLTEQAGGGISHAVEPVDTRVAEQIRELTDLLHGREGRETAAPAGKTALSWTTDHLLADATQMNDEYVSIAVSPVSGNLFSVFEATDLGGTDRDIHIAMSSDDGATWDVWEMPSFSLDEYHPDLAIDAGGYLLVTWIREDGYILRSKSTSPDDPLAWQWVLGLNVGEPCVTPSIAAKRQGTNGKVFIAAAWNTINWDLFQYEWTLIWMYSTDGGQTVQFDYFLPDGHNDYWPDVALKGSTCYFINSQEDGNTGEIDVLAAADVISGDFVNPVSLSDWTGMDCRFPSIASQSDDVFMVYQLDFDDGVGNVDGDIIYCYSWDGLAQVYGPYEMVTDEYESLGPTVYTKDGVVGCVWLDAPPGADEFYLASRHAGGSGLPDLWGEVEIASDLPHVNPAFHTVSGAITSENVHLAWSDRRDFPTQGLNVYTSEKFVAPDLAPFVPPGWGGSIVAGDTPGERVTDTLIAGDTSYVSFAFSNDGLSDIAADFRVRLTIDGAQEEWWVVTGGLPVGFYVTVEDFPIVVGSGLHIVGYELDFAGEIVEMDESDNTHLEIMSFTGGVTDVAGNPSPLPLAPRLEIRPNPFNPTTTIHYTLDRPAKVILGVHDVSGALVRTLVHGRRPAGEHEVRWDGRNNAGEFAPSGVYFSRWTDGANHLTRKMLLIR